MKKLFMAMLAVATIAMVGCKDEEETKTTPSNPGGGGGTEPSEMPEIAAPGAGKTTIAIFAKDCPAGAYIVGENGEDGELTWNEKVPTVKFSAVEDAENWYKVTIKHSDVFGAKVLAIPSDEDVEPGWSFQWGKNYDSEDPGDVPEGTENTKILKGTGEFVYENQGQPKLINVADNGVIYIEVKNWAQSPTIVPKKLETAWAKTNWDQAGDWTWREMEAKGNGVFEVTGVWGGNGFNIAATSGGADTWYALDNARFQGYDGQKAGDEVKLTFTSEKGTIGQLKMELVSAGELTYADVTISAVVPAGWTKCNLYTWNAEGNQTGDWPGEELTITAGKVEKSFTHVAVPLNFIFNNGEGAQTTDQSTEDNVADFDIEGNLKP